MCLARASQSLLKASVHRAAMVAELSHLDNWGSSWVTDSGHRPLRRSGHDALRLPGESQGASDLAHGQLQIEWIFLRCRPLDSGGRRRSKTCAVKMVAGARSQSQVRNELIEQMRRLIPPGDKPRSPLTR